jgi:hypothetical protein
MRGKHPAVKIRCPFMRGRIEIDKLLAPLMPLIWARGMETLQCCQESRRGLAEIEFENAPDVEEFLDVAQRLYKVEAETWEEPRIDESGKQHYRVRILVRFPTKDIPQLVKSFEAACREETD